MTRRARAAIGLVIVSLVSLEVTPTVPSVATARVPSGRCEIAATEQVVDLAAVPAGRPAAPVESASFERTALGGFTIVPIVLPATDPAAVHRRAEDARRRTGGTWVRALQQRARSPGDTDPH